MIAYGDLEKAARGDKVALQRLLKSLVDFSNLQAQNLGVDPVAAQQSTRAQRVQVPGLASMTVTGDDGHFFITLLNPLLANGEIYHEVQSSSTLPFSTSLDLITYGPSPATSRAINNPSKTYFWRWRSKYLNSGANRWQQLPEAVDSGTVRSIALSTLNTRQIIGETPLVQDGTSLTVDVLEFAARLGDVERTYDAGSVDVPTYDNYIIYFKDAKKLGGAVTYLATLDPLEANDDDANVIVGTVALSSLGGGLGVAYAQQFQSSCVIAGTQVRLHTGSDINAEDVIVGDELLGVDGGVETVVRVAEIPERPCWTLTTQNGRTLQGACSHHLLYGPQGSLPLVSALQIGDKILTRDGTENMEDFITVKTLLSGLQTVYRLVTDRTKTYLADGVWSRDLGGGRVA